MKFSLILSVAQLASERGPRLGVGGILEMERLADLLEGLETEIYELPCQAKNPAIASPFSLTSGFALSLDEIVIERIPEFALDPRLQEDLEEIQANYERHFRKNSQVGYAMRRSLLPWVLRRCHALLDPKDKKRKEEIEAFKELASYWLEDYALHQALLEADSPLLKEDQSKLSAEDRAKLLVEYRSAMEFYVYCQHLAYQQRLALKEYYRERGLTLTVNLPFGVEFQSADVFFHPEVFDVTRQVGCSPEPENGFPEQAWGIALYKERTEGLKMYLKARMKWLSLLGDGIFLDHLVGWCGQYALGKGEFPIEGEQVGAFLTEERKEREENILWFLKIASESGLKIKGEIAGDQARVLATKAGIDKMLKEGHEIQVMRIPRWESDERGKLPLAKYPKESLIMVETHDTATHLQYLCNQKGDRPDYESPSNILDYCHRVLALPLLEWQLPLSPGQITEEAALEIFRRLAQGSEAQDLAMTLPGLLSWLHPEHRHLGLSNDINVQPGTSGMVGNERLNWSLFGPPLEALSEERVMEALRLAAKREFRPFDWVHRGENAVGPLCLYSKPQNKRLLRFDEEGRLQLVESDHELWLELVLFNDREEELMGMLRIPPFDELPAQRMFRQEDLIDGRCFEQPCVKVKEEGLFYRMAPGQHHHLLLSLG